MKPHHLLVATAIAAATFGCTSSTTETGETTAAVQPPDSLQQKLDMYTNVRLTADLQNLSAKEKQMIPLLIEAADIMNKLFWHEAYGQKDSLLTALDSENAKRFVNINYGPWDRLNNNEPFIAGVGPKPEGANYYPKDMTKEEFEQASLPDKTSQYTLLRRDANGKLITVPYHVQFKEEVQRASELLKQAADLAEEPGLKKYLSLRAEALLTDNYQPSDLAWMDMKNNKIDVVIGPIETYEDKLFGYKAAHEAYVLVKDMEWSGRLAKYAAFLPELQRGLPVEAKYKQETPGTDSDLNAYDVVYYAGDSNAGSKTIAINLPNDEEVQLKKGTRRLQLKNAMRAKFDKIMEPIADELIVEDQQQHVTFDAFFANTMFHEVAHGLGIKNTVNGKGTVREALKEHASALEEGKADILGLYMITQLHEIGEVEGSLEDYYTTFLAGIFRSVRFGAASAHGKANMVRFNFFKENGAFERDEQTGKYRVNYVKMREAMNKLSEKILTLQGTGDYAGVGELLEVQGQVSPQLQSDLDRLAKANIPVDIVFEQGTDVLGL
ncbi:Zn-dependent hydrolase [Pontibacter toksunensis]|uniref:Zn-dependent hydrolase n=1 Tax=Pontibacter toksunensis TaxID=1332631 RepID=A0ABW6BSC9_9BACT